MLGLILSQSVMKPIVTSGCGSHGQCILLAGCFREQQHCYGPTGEQSLSFLLPLLLLPLILMANFNVLNVLTLFAVEGHTVADEMGGYGGTPDERLPVHSQVKWSQVVFGV